MANILQGTVVLPPEKLVGDLFSNLAADYSEKGYFIDWTRPHPHGDSGFKRLFRQLNVTRINRTARRQKRRNRLIVKSSPVLRGYYNVFYDRIHFNPSEVNIGALLNAQTREVELWNAYYSEVKITELEGEHNNGVDLQGLYPPQTLKPLQSLVLGLTVSLDGPPKISTSYVVRFESLPDLTLNVTGSRVIVFPLSPDTSKPLLESYRWATSKLMTKRHIEQRASLRETPESGIAFSVVFNNKEALLFDALLWGWQDRAYAVPLWQHQQTLTSGVKRRSSELSVDTRHRPFQVGGLAAIYAGSRKYEAVEIKEIQPDKLILEKPVDQNWQKGTAVFACRMGRLPNHVTSRWSHPRLGEADLKFVYEADEDIEPQDFNEVYRGYSVLPLVPNQAKPWEQGHATDVEIVGNRSGPRFIDPVSGKVDVLTMFTWWLKSAERIAQFKQWLFARRGSAVPFWVSTYKCDFTVVENISEGSDYLIVEKSLYTQLYSDKVGRRDIRIVTKRGEVFLRGITTVDPVTSDPEKEKLTLDEIFPADLRASAISMVSFLGLHRFESDDVEIEWIAKDLAQIQKQIRLLTNGI